MKPVRNPKVLRVITNPLLFTGAYLIYLLLCEISIVRQLLPPIHLVFVAWGALSIFWKLLTEPDFFRGKHLIPLFLLAAGMVVTFLLNRGSAPVEQIKADILNGIGLFFIYPGAYELLHSKDRWKKLYAVLTPLNFLIFILNTIALWMFCTFTVMRGSFRGLSYKIGLIFARYTAKGPKTMLLYGLYWDTNHAALIALFSVVLSIGALLFLRKHLSGKLRILSDIFHGVVLIVSSAYAFLANSRALDLVVLVLMAFTALLLIFRAIHEKKHKRIILVCVIYLLSLGAVRVTVPVLQKGTLDLVTIIYKETWGAKKKSQSAKPAQTAKKPPSKKGQAASVGFTKNNDIKESPRLVLWREAAFLWKKYPVFGIGPNNTKLYMLKYYKSNHSMLARGAAVHNSYLDALVSFGLTGFLCFAAFYLLLVKDWILALKRGLTDMEHLLTLMVLGLLGGIFFISTCFMGMSLLYALLLFLTGSLASVLREGGKKSPDEDTV